MPFGNHDAGHGADEGHHRTHGQINMPGNNHHHHTDRQDQDVAVLDDEVGDVDRAQRDAVRRDLEKQHDHDQGTEQANLAKLAGEVAQYLARLADGLRHFVRRCHWWTSPALWSCAA